MYFAKSLGATASTGLITRGVTTDANGLPLPATSIQVDDAGNAIHWQSPSPLTSWPYKGSPGESVLQIIISPKLDVDVNVGSGGLTYYSMEFPSGGGKFSMSGIADALASTITASLHRRGEDAIHERGGDAEAALWKFGVSLVGSGLNPETVDGGHPVPVSGLIATGLSPQGVPIFGSYAGTFQYVNPLYMFVYPNSSDVWGVYLMAGALVDAGPADQYVPAGLDAGAPNRKAARNLSILVQKLPQDGPMSSQSNPYYTGYDPFHKTGFWNSISNAFDAIWGVIVKIVDDLITLASALCAPAAVALGKMTPQQAAAVCGTGSGPPQCPAGQTLNPTTMQCEGALAKYLPFLLVGGGILLAIAFGGKKPS